MSRNNAQQQLYDLLVSKNYNPQMLDASGQPAPAADQATVFNFDWSSESGKDYGTVVVTLGDDHDFTIYFGDNLGKSMEGDDKKEWFDFLSQLSQFAKRNLMTFNVQNLNKLKYSQQGQQAMKEGIFESWQGIKNVSWNGVATEARLLIKHNRNIGEGEARFRNIKSLFIETAEGERYKLPFTKLSGGRAMLEHVRQGGKPYDVRGNHIATIVTEMNLLARFKRANQGKIFEGETQQLVEQATHYYESLQHNLKSLSSKSGYTKYFESWDPAAFNDEDVIIEDLRHMFIEQNIDSRIEQALPLLAKLQNQDNAMKEIGIFEGWMACMSEGIWSLPDTPEKQQELIALLSQELPVGPDGSNATEQLYDLLGDDELFNRLGDLARNNADADARSVILTRLEELKSNPAVAQVIGKLKVSQEQPAPAPEEPAEPVAEDQICETCHQHVCECGMHESIEEEISRISELSRDTLKSYIKKAGSATDPRSAPNLASRAGYAFGELENGGGDPEGDDGAADDHKAWMRSKGIDRAVDRLEELSPDTLKSYIKKAAGSAANKGAELGQKMAASDEVDRYTNRHMPNQSDERERMRGAVGAGYDDISKVRSKTNQRVKGIAKATDRLEELSPGTLGSYIKKASSDRAGRNFDQGVDTGSTFQDREPKFDKENSRKDDQRRAGIHKAVNRLVKEESDTVEKDSEGKVKSWKHEGDWKKTPKRDGKPVNPRGEVTNMVGKELQKAKSLKESGMGEADILFQEIARGNVDIYDIYAHPKTAIEEFVSDQIHDRVEELSRERGIPMDDDIDKILQIIVDDLSAEYGVDESMGGGNFLEDSEPTVYEIYQTKGCKPYNAVLRTFSANTPEEAQADLEKFKQRRPEVDPSYFDVRELTDAGKHLDQLRQARERKPALEEGTALTGQYGHSGKLQPVQGTNADMMDRIKFLAGITK